MVTFLSSRKNSRMISITLHCFSLTEIAQNCNHKISVIFVLCFCFCLVELYEIKFLRKCIYLTAKFNSLFLFSFFLRSELLIFIFPPCTILERANISNSGASGDFSDF